MAPWPNSVSPPDKLIWVDKRLDELLQQNLRDFVASSKSLPKLALQTNPQEEIKGCSTKVDETINLVSTSQFDLSDKEPSKDPDYIIRTRILRQMERLEELKFDLKKDLPSPDELSRMTDRELLLHYNSFMDSKEDEFEYLKNLLDSIGDRAKSLKDQHLLEELDHVESLTDVYLRDIRNHQVIVSQELTGRNIDAKNPNTDVDCIKPVFDGTLLTNHFYEFQENFDTYARQSHLSKEMLSEIMRSCLKGECQREVDTHFGKNSRPSSEELRKFLKCLYGNEQSLLTKLCVAHTEVGMIEGKCATQRALSHHLLIKKAQSLERNFPSLIMGSQVYAETLDDILPDEIYVTVTKSARFDYVGRINDIAVTIERLASRTAAADGNPNQCEEPTALILSSVIDEDYTQDDAESLPASEYSNQYSDEDSYNEDPPDSYNEDPLDSFEEDDHEEEDYEEWRRKLDKSLHDDTPE